MQVYTTLSAVRGPEHLHTLLSMADLARIYREQCRTSEAEALQREVMDKSLRTLGADHSEPLSSIVNLSSIVRAAADLLRTDDPARTLKLAEAQDLQIIALEKASRITGARSPTTMLHIASPAGIYDLQSQWAQAEPFWSQVLDETVQTCGQIIPKCYLSNEASPVAWRIKAGCRRQSRFRGRPWRSLHVCLNPQT